MLVPILQEGTSMTTNEALYLVLVIAAFLAFAGTLSILNRQRRR